MEKQITKFVAVAKAVDDQITLCKESLEESFCIMTLMDNNEKDYNEAYKAYAAVSLMLRILTEFRGYIFNQGRKRAIAYLRFTVHQIERFTDSSLLGSETSTGDPVLDTKITIHGIFRKYLEILEIEE